MTDETYPAPPRLTLDDLDPESAITDPMMAMARAHPRAAYPSSWGGGRIN